MISHRSQSNCYLIILLLLNYARREVRLVFFFTFSIKLFKRIHQNDNIRATLNWTLLWSYCEKFEQANADWDFYWNINEKVRSSSRLFCIVSFIYLKCTRQFLWKILMGCTPIILHVIFFKGFTCILLYSKHDSRKSYQWGIKHH